MYPYERVRVSPIGRLLLVIFMLGEGVFGVGNSFRVNRYCHVIYVLSFQFGVRGFLGPFGSHVTVLGLLNGIRRYPS